jgi:hypothetical protein
MTACVEVLMTPEDLSARRLRASDGLPANRPIDTAPPPQAPPARLHAAALGPITGGMRWK